MSRFVLSSAVLWLGSSALNAHAVPPGAFAPSAPSGPAAPAGPGAPHAQAVLESAVARLLTNPYGEVDGLRLTDGTVVRFPPHMSDALTAAVKVGDTVRIIGRSEAGGAVKADAIVNSASGQTVYDQPPARDGARPMPPHLRMAGLQTQQAQGRIDVVLTGPRGDANGVILSDGAIVRFAPHALQQPLQPGQLFAASGLGTRNAHGTSLEATSMGASLSDLQPLYDRAR